MKNFIKKIVLTCLILSLNPLFGMDNNSNKEDVKDLAEKGIDWPAYKKLFFKWYGYGAIGTEDRWKCFKEGVKNNAITITPITKTIKPVDDKYYYLAYSKKVHLDNNTVARFMYPSPNNAYSGYPINDTDMLYTIDTAVTSVLVVAQWNTNSGENNEGSLPLALQPSEKYFPDWKNNPKLWVFWTTIKSTNNQNK